jgi:hypothetical protein
VQKFLAGDRIGRFRRASLMDKCATRALGHLPRERFRPLGVRSRSAEVWAKPAQRRAERDRRVSCPGRQVRPPNGTRWPFGKESRSVARPSPPGGRPPPD